MRYKVWVENDEQWDADTVEKPDIELEAGSDVGAAIDAHEKLTGRHHGALKFIVQPVGRGKPAFVRIELALRPLAVNIGAVTISELRDELVVAPVTRTERVSKGGRR